MALLELKNIFKKYKLAGNEEFTALKNINVSFDKGELVSIIGESGSGKSTLMNLIGGLDSNFEGELLYKGRNIGTFKESELVNYHKENIGFVFQSFNLIPHLNLLDNVSMAMTLSNVDSETRKKRALEVLTDMGLKDHVYKKPNQISGGQKQRVAIARALVNDPDIIIADEPTGALDAETTNQVLDIITEIAQRGKLVIMVTHSEKVAAYSSRVVKIDNGEIVGDEEGRTLNHIEERQVSKKNAKNKNLGFFSAMRLSLLNMKEKFSRNLLVAVGSSIGIMSVILMMSIGNGVTGYVTDKMNSFVNPEVIQVNKPAENKTKSTESMSIKEQQEAQSEQMMNGLRSTPITGNDINKLEKINHVDSVEKGYNLTAMGSNYITYDGKKAMIMDFMSTSSNLVESNLSKGKMPKDGEILISDMIASELGDDIVGKTVEVKLLVDEKIITESFKVSGVYEGTGNMSYMPYNSISSWFSKEGINLEPNTVYLHADDKSNTDSIKNAVKDLGYTGSMQESMIEMFTDMIDMLSYVLTGVAGISLVVSAIMILVVLNISVVERTKEIGVLKALGARLKDIRRIFVTEAFLLGIFGGLIGIGASYGIGAIANHFTRTTFDFNVVRITPTYALAGILISVVISMLASFLPANKAARLDPVESLRRD
ncbi:ATP-binding cassette domain-containing protein [Paraclostridium bifermentans]|uniref:ABC transporter ATP-binding protein/permease n=1 Tax=Paraclostridium bifermentans TaxID=1490 RepID=UPI00189AF43F|nr:ABC transporter ATP-binding protein/permease [Paraclostridium bifermentans]